jgi:ATP-dependent Clp protease ATP-binding subunit ClpA
MSMYGGFTDRSCRVLLEMRDEAFVLDHDHTGTEHLLLAILEVNDDLTAPVLRRFGVQEADLRREVRRIVTPDLDLESEGSWTHIVDQGDPENSVAARTGLPDNEASPRKFTPRLLTCLMRLARFEAQELGDRQIGPEHLLLSVLKERHGIGVQALANLGVDIQELTLAVYARIAEAPESSDPTVLQPTDERRETMLDVRRMLAGSQMNMEDRVVFTESDAARVYCILDGLDRLFDKDPRPVVEQITKTISESFAVRAGQSNRFTSDEQRRILSTIVSGLRRRAGDQLGD